MTREKLIELSWGLRAWLNEREPDEHNDEEVVRAILLTRQDVDEEILRRET